MEAGPSAWLSICACTSGQMAPRHRLGSASLNWRSRVSRSSSVIRILRRKVAPWAGTFRCVSSWTRTRSTRLGGSCMSAQCSLMEPSGSQAPHRSPRSWTVTLRGVTPVRSARGAARPDAHRVPRDVYHWAIRRAPCRGDSVSGSSSQPWFSRTRLSEPACTIFSRWRRPRYAKLVPPTSSLRGSPPPCLRRSTSSASRGSRERTASATACGSASAGTAKSTPPSSRISIPSVRRRGRTTTCHVHSLGMGSDARADWTARLTSHSYHLALTGAVSAADAASANGTVSRSAGSRHGAPRRAPRARPPGRRSPPTRCGGGLPL